ncbi:OmpA family protein [uncultured Fibrella sp.]|uniref:OmpA family protein n=1 Tax=uncultured Fibrella sp. TaxID=1284596 RepID=UPI0035C987FB
MTIFSKAGLVWGLFCSTLPGFSQGDKASLEGLVLDAATHQPIIGATVQALTQTGNATQAKSLAPDGSFKLNLSAKESYRIVTQAAGYIATEDRMAFTDSRAVRLFGKTIYLNRTLPTSTPVAAASSAQKKASPAPKSAPASTAAKPLTITDQPVELRAIQFTQSTADMVPEAQADLDRLLTFLTQNPTISIELAGHTDNQGDFDQNVTLSRQRAETVKSFLVSKGIAATRIFTKGYGGTRPVATNNYEKSRQFNRRVEMRVIKQ